MVPAAAAAHDGPSHCTVDVDQRQYNLLWWPVRDGSCVTDSLDHPVDVDQNTSVS